MGRDEFYYNKSDNSVRLVKINSDLTFATTAKELSELKIKNVECVSFFDKETGEKILHWDINTGGSDATSANTD